MTRRKHSKVRFISFLLIILLIGIFLYRRSDLQELLSPISSRSGSIPSTITPLQVSSTPYPTETIDISTNLGKAVASTLAKTTGIYGIAVKNLKTGESFSVNGHRSFAAGSLYKLWVMATVYEQIEKKKLNEIDVISQDVYKLNKEFYIPSESAEKTEGTITLSVNDALDQMITISDNYAALLLAERIKLSNIVSFLQRHGLSESVVGTDGSAPTITPSDTALFLEKLYKGELASKENTDKMITLLKTQKLNDKLPKYLPQEIDIAHKTGELDQFTHDAGIVYGPAGDYIITILSESDSRPQAEERIASVSQAVYNYFTSGN